MDEKVVRRCKRKRRIFSDVYSFSNAWIEDKTIYGTIKGKNHVRETSFLHNLLFIGNGCIAYKNDENKQIIFFSPHSWYSVRICSGIEANGKHWRRRIYRIKQELRSREYNIIETEFIGTIFSATLISYRIFLQGEYIKAIRNLFVSTYVELEDGIKYWTGDDTFTQLCNQIKKIEEINQANGWKLTSGLSLEEEERFNLDRLMHILGGEVNED